MFRRFIDWVTRLILADDTVNWLAVGVLLVVFISPVLLLSTFSYIKTRRDLTDFALSRRQTVAYLAAGVLKEKFDSLTAIGISLATRPRLREAVSTGKWNEAVRYLRSVPQDFPEVARISLTDPSGTLMADTPELSDVKGRNFAFRDWYQGVSKEWVPYLSDVYHRAADPRYCVIDLAVPIKAGNQKVVGILLLEVQVDVLLEWTKKIEVGSSGFVYVVDRIGQIAAHPKFPPQRGIVDFSKVPVVQKVLRGERGVDILFNPIENEERLSAYEPLPGYGWGVIAQQPTDAAFAARDSNLRRTLIAYSLLCLLSGFLAYLILHAMVVRRRAEQETHRLNAQLEAANRELEAFSYSVSHDLRAPLRGIDGFSQALLEDYADKVDGQGKDYLRRVREASQHMAQLIDDLLNLSRVSREEIQREEVDLSAMARTIATELRKSQPERRVEFVIANGLVANADERLLRVAMENLLENAWKFTGKHAQATIEIGVTQVDGEQVFYVRDNGAGFDMAYADKLFGTFQRLHGRTEFPGTGIGLATVQRIVHRHGGRPWAKGGVGKGATFYFTLQ
jgi:signal transduction histidine kinase